MTDTIDYPPARPCISSHEAADCVSIKFAGPITIENVKEIKPVLGEVLSLKKNTILNGGDIEKIDTAVVQDIWSFMREAQKLEQPVAWTSTSETLNQVAA